ncbi:MAG: 6-phosphogluconolactonase [Candidatus Marsarchaeota archaeon]|nr:6-phosphogluconolactonase [Candidatus Marsarchaeota archaeon]
MGARLRLIRLGKKELPSSMQSAFVDFVSRSLKERPMLLIGLPGGHSLDGFYDGLGKRIPLQQRRHLFFFAVDERVVGAKSKENNGKMLQKLLCDAKLANPKQVLRLNTEMEKKGVIAWAAERGAYENLLSALAPQGADLLIFGVGEDGHIGSLFPKRKELEEKGGEWLEVADAPKPPASRVSISPEQIRKAKEVWLVFRGKEKQKALEKFLDSHTPLKDCPAKLVLDGKHAVRVWTDLK